MKTNGKQTYRGQDFEEDTNAKIKRLLGYEETLYKHAKDGTEQQKRNDARSILEDDENNNLNARQLILKAKGPHGAGENLSFPTRKEIEDTHHAAAAGKEAEARRQRSLSTSDHMEK